MWHCTYLFWLVEVRIRFTLVALTVAESAGTVNLAVEREGASAHNFTILLTTADGSARGLLNVVITVVINNAICKQPVNALSSSITCFMLPPFSL